MSPPYRLIDVATGQTVFDNMDTEPGRFIEVYAGPSPSAPDARISPGALERPGGAPPDPGPGPDPNPPSGGDMDYPKNESELRQCLMSYRDNKIVGMLDPRTKVDVSSTIEIEGVDGGGVPWGVNGNYAKIYYKGQGGDALKFIGSQGKSVRGLTVKNLMIDGGDAANFSGAGAAACLRLSAPLGDNGPLYKFHVENVFLMGAVNGLVLEGGVYEGELRTIHVENCTGDGVLLQHMMNPVPPGGKNPIVSNIKMYHINSSRNFGAGLKTVYSVYLYGASFVLNGGGGIYAPEGIRGAFGVNGENTGGKNQCVIDCPSNGYGSVIEVGEASSDGVTHCRKFNGTTGQWESVGKPLLYFAAIDPNVKVLNSHTSYYGQGTDPMKVIKP